MGEAKDLSTEEVYQIDYRGPETHPVFPFPSRGRPRFRPEHPNSKPSPRAKDSESKVSCFLYNITIMEFIRTFPWEFQIEHVKFESKVRGSRSDVLVSQSRTTSP